MWSGVWWANHYARLRHSRHYPALNTCRNSLEICSHRILTTLEVNGVYSYGLILAISQWRVAGEHVNSQAHCACAQMLTYAHTHTRVTHTQTQRGVEVKRGGRDGGVVSYSSVCVCVFVLRGREHWYSPVDPWVGW